jgi:UDP-N-acetylglucosamine transferase subunit ALG13
LKYKSLVIIGNLKKDFSRLIKLTLKNIQVIPKPILIQYGHTNIERIDLNNNEIIYEKFIDNEKILSIIKDVEVVIAHCGAGIILETLSSKKKAYIIPREKKNGEHIDDHQIELYNYLLEKKLILKFNDLKNKDNKTDECQFINNNEINNFIKNYIYNEFG